MFKKYRKFSTIRAVAACLVLGSTILNFMGSANAMEQNHNDKQIAFHQLPQSLFKELNTYLSQDERDFMEKSSRIIYLNNHYNGDRVFHYNGNTHVIGLDPMRFILKMTPEELKEIKKNIDNPFHIAPRFSNDFKNAFEKIQQRIKQSTKSHLCVTLTSGMFGTWGLILATDPATHCEMVVFKNQCLLRYPTNTLTWGDVTFGGGLFTGCCFAFFHSISEIYNNLVGNSSEFKYFTLAQKKKLYSLYSELTHRP